MGASVLTGLKERDRDARPAGDEDSEVLDDEVL
jgi:hypothetical protein